VIALVDYGAGNLTSVKKALRFLGADFVVPDRTALLEESRGVIVPGVGHFGATARLQGEWYDTIARVTREGKPLLGICVGMQWLFEGSDEAPEAKGLGVMRGRLARLKGNAERRLKVPHVGWNALDFCGSPGSAPRRPARILEGLTSGVQVYFTHSYAPPVTGDTVASTTHCDTFASVVERDNVFGVQFHPEKSGDAGLQMLRNFLQVCER
jgi:glutamine amidotransferase